MYTVGPHNRLCGLSPDIFVFTCSEIDIIIRTEFEGAIVVLLDQLVRFLSPIEDYVEAAVMLLQYYSC